MRRSDKPVNESDLCDRFAKYARSQGWEVYPEVKNWDLVLVATPAVVAKPAKHRGNNPSVIQVGDRLAIEAKMRPSIDALAQTHQRLRYNKPNFAAILVPESHGGLRYVADVIGINVMTLDSAESYQEWITLGHRIMTQKPMWVPPIPLEGPGGSPSPRTLSGWRVGALKICHLLRTRGWVTNDDFSDAKITSGMWVTKKWIKRDGKIGKLSRYVISAPDKLLPDFGYETERDKIATIVT